MILLISQHSMTYLSYFHAVFTTMMFVFNFFVHLQNSISVIFRQTIVTILNNASAIICLGGVLWCHLNNILSLFLQLQHGILKSLSGTAFVWLLQMLQAFYAGSMSQFESVMAEQKGRQVWNIIIFKIMKVWFMLNDCFNVPFFRCFVSSANSWN